MTATLLETAKPSEGTAAAPSAGQVATPQGAATGTPAPEQKAPNASTPATAAEPAKEGAGTTPKVGAPEKYEFKAPEGQAFNTHVLDAYSAVARELNLSQGDAQKMLDRIAPALEQSRGQQLETVQRDWVSQATRDQEFGGDKLNENLGVAKRAIDTFGTPELRKLLDTPQKGGAGLGNNPEFIRLMFRVGKALQEDRFVRGTGEATTSMADPTRMAAVLYPNTK